jgi:hypothetical protein
MELDENLNMKLQQFDPNPIKRGELVVSKRSPDYFL